MKGHCFDFDEKIREGYKVGLATNLIAKDLGINTDAVRARAMALGVKHPVGISGDLFGVKGVVPIRFRVRNGTNIENWISNWSFPEPNSGCWLWTGSLNKSGYGETTWKGKLELAHRTSWALNKGQIPNGLQVLHRCDNRICTNPDHLFLGTNYDNVLDKISKKRSWKTIPPEVAKEIYHAQGRHKDIALKYGVVRSTVGLIKQGKSRRHDVV